MSQPNASPTIYFIPGLGADGRLFEALKRKGLPFKVLEFITPRQSETLSEYALRLGEGIDRSRPFIVGGVSLGGILAMEVDRHYGAQKVLLISSVKHSGEFPFYFKFFRYIPVHRLFSGQFLKTYAPRENRRRMPQWKADILEQMRQDADPVFVKWAVDAVVRWRFRERPQHVVHIHGTRDLMFPGLLLGPRVKIKKGGHVMVLTREEEVIEVIQRHI